jgi:type II pantothenate kinase
VNKQSAIMAIKKRVIVYMLTMSAAIIFVGMIRRRQKREISKRRKKKKEGSINIGGNRMLILSVPVNHYISFCFLSVVNLLGIFGMDIGGTLSKIVYFERKSVGSEAQWGKRDKSFEEYNSPQHQVALAQIYRAMLSQSFLGTTGVRDESLSFYSSFLGGRFHFIHFESRQMPAAIRNLSSTEITANIKSIGCTGGGAHKYSNLIKDVLEIQVLQFDELKCLVRGMHFVMMNYEQECYTYRYDDDAERGRDITWQRDAKDYCRKVHIPYSLIQNDQKNDMFPYLVVSIGSGVSIMKVNAPGDFVRVSGTSIGGGTYWGLCRLFTRCSTFEQVLELAEIGNNAEVDMLVSDIYGGNYDQMNLKGSMVASNFGKLVMEENPREGLKEADLAISLLMMITNNIGQVAYLNAMLHNCKKIFFVGNFLRNNAISLRRLAFAISFWSKGTMEAMFLEHEGYFGALGAFLESAFGETVDNVINVSNKLSKEKKETTTAASLSHSSTKSPEYFDREGAALHFVSSPSPPSHTHTRRRRSKAKEYEDFSVDEAPQRAGSRHRTVSMTGHAGYPSSTPSPRSRHGNLMFSGEFQSKRRMASEDSEGIGQGLSGGACSPREFPPGTGTGSGSSPPLCNRSRTRSLDSYALNNDADIIAPLFGCHSSSYSLEEDEEEVEDLDKNNAKWK